MGWFRRLLGGEQRVPVAGEAPARPLRRPVWGIHRDALELIMEASRDQHPKEFGATLRAEKGVITEVVLTPGTIAGDRHTFINYIFLPIDPTIVGTVHSHPGPSAEPSDADKRVFSAFGHTHVIIAEPYDEESWIAYDTRGEPIDMEIVDGT